MNQEYCIGLDVHKSQTTFSVKSKEGITLAEGECATQYRDIKKNLSEYLDKASIVMEACTSYYHLYESMKKDKIDVHVANVIQLRKCIGKNDKIDAERLADMYRLNSLPEAYIPDKKIQTLRIMINIYHNLVCEGGRLQNQIRSMLDMKGFFCPIKELTSKKGMSYINSYLQANNDLSMRYLYESLNEMVQRIKRLTIEIDCYVKENFSEEYVLLKTIPGVGDIIAAYLIAEICPIERFSDKKKLRRYAGVIPIKEQSDKKIYATYLPKHASRRLLRYALVLAANAAARFNSKLRTYYNKKKKGKTHGHAIMCVTSSLSDIIYHVLSTKKPYNK